MKGLLLSVLLLMFSKYSVAQTQSYQQRIDQGFKSFFITRSSDSINNIIKELKGHNLRGSENNTVSYWKAYALFHSSQQDYMNKKRRSAVRKLDKAIKTMEKIDNKNSEDYALLAVLLNFKLTMAPAFALSRYIKFPKNMFAKIKENASQAIAMEENNLRAWLALAILDYKTPIIYGGQSECEDLFRKVITMPEKYSDDPKKPDWGKKQAYFYLATYLQKKDSSKADEILAEGLQLYPDDYDLGSLKRNLQANN